MPPVSPPHSLQDGSECSTSAALHLQIAQLTKRADFLAAARGLKRHKEAFVMQARCRKDDAATVRIGFTCSRKVGNAVARNRAKRRLREAARIALPRHANPGWDYVLIGRHEKTAAQPFDALVRDLCDALQSVAQ